MVTAKVFAFHANAINIFFTSFTVLFEFTFHSFSQGPCFSILHSFSFNWKVATATATTSFNHAKLRGASASTELLYQVTDTFNHYLFQGATLTGFYQSENLLKMDFTNNFSQYPKASCFSGKELHHRRLYSKG